MPWSKTANAAMYQGANWSSYIKTVPNCPPELARRVALSDPDIGFFFHCRGPMELRNPEWSAPRQFNAGDSVFFSGEPSWGSAPQCDGYVKNGMAVAYINDATPENVAEAGCYTSSDGSAAIDVVCIFAANLNSVVPSGTVHLTPGISVPAGGTYAVANQNLFAALQSGAIKQLQAKGITVLLTFLNNHDAAGWSEFNSEPLAQNFVDQLQAVVEQYGLDGIDIDDEYSNGEPSNESLAMVTGLMKKALPGKIISKALYQDAQYFDVVYNGATLQQNLTYGWEMSYGGSPQDRLPSYVEIGMSAKSLVLGFFNKQQYGSPESDVKWLKNEQYGGVMVYAFEELPNCMLLGQLVDYWCGPGNWKKQA